MKIYTGSGDLGKTSLFSGERILKSHIQVEAYGDVDELNSVLGMVAAVLAGSHPQLNEQLQRMQQDLLIIGALLATTPESPVFSQLQEIDESSIKFIEENIDRMEEKLEPLQHFILPGGHISSAWSHLARAVCRRAERHVILFSEHVDEGDFRERLFRIIAYLNRLSDHLFVLARYCNFLHKISDVKWKK